MNNDESSPVATLQRFYAAEAEYFSAGGRSGGANFDPVAETLDPDFVLHIAPDLPWGGEWRGREGFADWAARMSELNESFEVQAPRLFADGDTVLTDLTLVVRARATGTIISAPSIQVVRIVDRLIVDFRAFYWNVPQYLRAYDDTHT